MNKNQVTYSESLKELETLIHQVESGEPGIDELAGMVKRATELIKSCQEKLRSTEADLNEFLNATDHD
ncbi:MAG: exodeoxyribonuclease VII small subunit [Cytophagales bacterium]|nr:exodeoxyribonuclease VII small subunit [Cytophagales bacterium]